MSRNKQCNFHLIFVYTKFSFPLFGLHYEKENQKKKNFLIDKIILSFSSKPRFLPFDHFISCHVINVDDTSISKPSKNEYIF